FELKQAEERAHILEGLKIAVANIDKVIALIKAAKDTETAKQGLMQKFKLSERQAVAILEMKLARLTNLERHKIDEEYLGLIKEIARLKSLLASRKAVMELIKNELMELRKRYADERRTDIVEGKVEELKLEDLIAEEDVTVIVTHRGYIKRMPISVYRRQTRGGIGRSGLEMTETDYVQGIITASTHDYMLFFTNQGRCYWLKVHAIPEGSYQSKGRPIVNLIQLEQEERISSYVAVREFLQDRYVFMVTRQGRVKKTSLEAFAHVRSKGIIAIHLDKGDELIDTFVTSGRDEVLLVTEKGQALKCSEKDVRAMGRAAAGVRGLRLAKGDAVINAVVAQDDRSLLVISELGYGKRTDFRLFPKRHRGGKGVIAFKILPKSGKLVRAHSVAEGEEVIIITRAGTVLRVKTDEIRRQGRASTGVRIITVREGDMVADIAPAD
ncbi:MAG: DNA gyrase C-terminal beta-propeller domain-containing protein, partial [candidate division WOR-3 bacterium]